MKRISLFFILSYALLLGACQSGNHALPEADNLELSWAIEGNYIDSTGQTLSYFTLINKDKQALGNKNWSLYFNFIRTVESSRSPKGLRFEHVNGDIYRLFPTDSFAGLKSGDTLLIPMYSHAWLTNSSDAPAGPFWVFEKDNKKTAYAVNDFQIGSYVGPQQVNRSATDMVLANTPLLEFQRDSALRVLPQESLCPIVPTPLHFTYFSGQLVIDDSWKIAYDKAFQAEAALLKELISERIGKELYTTAVTGKEGAKTIYLVKGNVFTPNRKQLKSEEAYQLIIQDGNTIRITANAAHGIFYGVQSLRSLMLLEEKLDHLPLRQVAVIDEPRFPYRGFHLDVGRNFQTKESVLRLIDIMSMYKLNAFHMHLSEDEGWRLEIPELPELTTVGSKRGYSEDPLAMLPPSFGSGPDSDNAGSGFYTRSDFKEIIRYANARHIEVIPEFDLPGHSRAAIVSMKARQKALLEAGKSKEEANRYILHDPKDSSKYKSVQGWTDNVICPCQESSYRFIETVYKSVAQTYKEAGVPLKTMHIGGDEVPVGVWEKSPACAELRKQNAAYNGTNGATNYFLARTNAIISKMNLVTAGWEEIGLIKEPYLNNGKEEIRWVPNPAFADSSFRCYVWNNVTGWGMEDISYQLANSGYKVVLGNVTNLYFDLCQEKDPEEPGYYWGGYTNTRKVWDLVPSNMFLTTTHDLMGNPIDPKVFSAKVRLTEKGKQNLIGIQGHLWGENIKEPYLIDYMYFPRALALAERAWTSDPAWASIADNQKRKAATEEAWNDFANRVGQIEMKKLGALSVGYRVATPGAQILNGVLYANASFPGTEIHYTTDGTEPSASSPLYSAPVDLTRVKTIKLIAVSGNRVSRVVTLNP